MKEADDIMMDDTTASPKAAEPRMCPNCGTLGEESFCSKDGTPTIRISPLRKHPRSYEVGDVIGGRYRVTGALGAGGFAAVFAAQHTLTEQPVAVKLLAMDPGDASARVTVRRFFREAQVTAALTSPNTVRVFDVGQDEGGALYIAMELMRGESLEGLLKRRIKAENPLTEAEAIDLALPLLASLAEAHGKGLVHRDLKPANIFLAETTDGERTVKVLDFGIARTSDSSLTLGGSIPGTPPFMSPEQCRGEEIDGRSDLYAIAVILYLSATANLPFYNTNVLKLMRMHAFDPAPDPRSKTSRPLGEGFARVLLRCLAKHPAERPRSAEALHDELVAVHEGTWIASEWSSANAEAQAVPLSEMSKRSAFDEDNTTDERGNVIALAERVPTTPGRALDVQQATLASAPALRRTTGDAPRLKPAPDSAPAPRQTARTPSATAIVAPAEGPSEAALSQAALGAADVSSTPNVGSSVAPAPPAEVAAAFGSRPVVVAAAVVVVACVAIAAWWLGRGQQAAPAPAAASGGVVATDLLPGSAASAAAPRRPIRRCKPRRWRGPPKRSPTSCDGLL